LNQPQPIHNVDWGTALQLAALANYGGLIRGVKNVNSNSIQSHPQDATFALGSHSRSCWIGSILEYWEKGVGQGEQRMRNQARATAEEGGLHEVMH
jgi:hypothetical protein